VNHSVSALSSAVNLAAMTHNNKATVDDGDQEHGATLCFSENLSFSNVATHAKFCTYQCYLKWISYWKFTD